MKLILRTLFFILILSILSLSIVSLREVIFTDVYTVTEDSITVSQDVTAKITRNEKELSARITGDISYNVQNVQKVKKGEKIANVYDSKLLPQERERISYLNDRIALLQEQVATSEGFEHNSEGLKLASLAFQKEVIALANQNNYEEIGVRKNSFFSFLGNANIKEEASQLEKEMQALENKHKGHFQVVTAPMSGVFIKDSNIGKIVDNYEITLTTTVPNVFLENTYIGNSYGITFLDFGIKTIGEVSDMHKIDITNSVVVFAIRNYVYKFYDANEVKANIVFSSNYGLKVPKEAIVTVDGVSGVYVKTDKIKEFKPVEILARNEDFVIIKSNDNVKQYDEVVIKH